MKTEKIFLEENFDKQAPVWGGAELRSLFWERYNRKPYSIMEFKEFRENLPSELVKKLNKDYMEKIKERAYYLLSLYREVADKPHSAGCIICKQIALLKRTKFMQSERHNSHLWNRNPSNESMDRLWHEIND